MKPETAKKQGLNARLVATTILTRIIDDQRNLDALCDKEHGLKTYLSLDIKDRSLVRAIVVTALRNRNAISFILSKCWDRPPPKRARFLYHALHVASAQILYLNLPDHTAVDLAVSSIGDDERTKRFRAMSNAILRRMVREKDKLLEKSQTASSPYPKWFEKALNSDYGKKKSAEISRYVTSEPRVDITVKTNPEEWAEKLGGIMLPTGSVRLLHSDPIETLEGFEDGQWWVQNTAAALPAHLLKLDTGSKILELCAAPGGKTAQLCNTGFEVSALDISKPRLERLKTNLERLNFKAELIEADIMEYKPTELFDGVLLDAPCSSTGTIRRHPDVVWTREAADIKTLAQLQFDLIGKAREFVKPGGSLVFANCSILKEEGENLLSRIKEKFSDLKLDPIQPEEIYDLKEMINGQGIMRTLPNHLNIDDNVDNSGLDGFFTCRYIKQDANCI